MPAARPRRYAAQSAPSGQYPDADEKSLNIRRAVAAPADAK